MRGRRPHSTTRSPTRWCAAGASSPGATVSEDLRTLTQAGGRGADDFYRDRWSHDKVVRSTHGVNCTGSCSWKVYVKDGIITWETQQTDYPSVGPDSPEYEPRGCPRGAAFSWYTYSPTRVRYPYVRGVLLQMYREAKAQHDGDPVAAWAHIVDNPQRAQAYKSARGKGGLVRASWDEATEMVAAAYVHTIKKWGPDRVAGFSPIPAMSMVSHASGARFTSLVGGSMLSFYDWYADLPVASPQVFGDQTDVPESGDWWDAGYLIMWGSNVPVTRTPDAHWMTEARYRGQKVVVVSPDYADNVKFADEWLAVRPGHRRRPGHGDGSRRCSRSSSSTGRRRTSSTTPRGTPTCPSSSPSTTRPGRRDRPRRQVPHRGRPARPRRRGERPLQDRADRLPDRRARGAATALSATGSATTAWAGGTSTSVTSTRLLTLLDARRTRPWPSAAALRRRRTDAGSLPRGVPGPPGRRPAGHHGLRPDAGPVRRRPRRARRRLRLVLRRRRRRRTPRPGRRRSPACPAAAAARIAREFAQNAEESGAAR